ncbi:type II secretion system F family protein [Bacilliculturomica massiliensis]|uniref:type II secretion system F family protein n=1 Tax=Bacilliculturomica massiliensis TaxID=1917867 RepID=UPI0010323DB0|nr:type II secretion system F family protein [Bacilliculturomica massiliensis]
MKAILKKKGPVMAEREDGLTDYNIYIMKKSEKLFYILMAAAALFAVGYIFYHSVILSALLALLSLHFPSIRTGQIIEKRKKTLTVQFKDMLYSLSASLSAGRSVESGLKDCLKDLEIIYQDPDTDILLELEYILRGLEMNETVERMFQQFAERAHLEDVDNFTDVFIVCKRTGGDIIQVIRSTASTISEKIEIQQEIETMISGKKFEFHMLMAMPVVMVALLSWTAADYMAPVFQGIAGRLIMTIAVGLFGAAYIVGKKVMSIDV